MGRTSLIARWWEHSCVWSALLVRNVVALTRHVIRSCPRQLALLALLAPSVSLGIDEDAHTPLERSLRATTASARVS